MKQLAGDASAEGLICSQAGLPALAASKEFLDGYKAKFNVDPIIYAPFTYDAANLLIAAMQKADSADPAKYLPELQKISHKGATGTIEFDDKGDRKNAEITIFTMKAGKLEPIAVVQGGKSIAFAEFMKPARRGRRSGSDGCAGSGAPPRRRPRRRSRRLPAHEKRRPAGRRFFAACPRLTLPPQSPGASGTRPSASPVQPDSCRLG